MIEFTDGDRAQPLWNKLQQYWRDELATLRAKNDNAALTADQTAALRGEIKQVKAFLAMDEKAPQVDPTPMDRF